MKTDQVKLIKMAIDILSKDVFIKTNNTNHEVAVATASAIKLLEQVITDRAEYEKHSASSEEFAKDKEPFLKDLIKKIADQNMNGTVMVQTNHENPTERIDLCMSTMDESRMIQSFTSFFLKYGPDAFIKFMKNMVMTLGGKFEFVPLNFTPSKDLIKALKQMEINDDESSTDMGEDKE